MDFQAEIEAMRTAYRNHPPKKLKLVRPSYITDKDELSAVFRELDVLLYHGMVCYGSLIQANNLLFKPFPRWDCPATVLYGINPETDENPLELRAMAHEIYQYKNKPEDEIPEDIRQLAAVITDEHDRSSFRGTVTQADGRTREIFFQSLMVFRKYLPKHKLCGSILPILAAPDFCSSILILPKAYWTKEFTKAWTAGQV